MVQTAEFAKWVSLLLAETFGDSDSPSVYILDTGRSGLLGTIDALSPEAASAARAPGQATIASHCGHILFLLRVFDACEQGQTPEMDWPGSWSARDVDETAWAVLRGELRAACNTVVARVSGSEMWPEPRLAAALILLAHCAYHVGEIRQRLLWVTP